MSDTIDISENDPITQKLNELNTNVGSAQNGMDSTGAILSTERKRLRDRQKIIIDAKFGQNRIIDLNRNQMKRNAAYTKVGIFATVALGIVVLLRLFGGFIPEAILSLIYVLLISMAVFYGLMVYTDVRGREATNYDRYNIPPPVQDISDAEKEKQRKAAVKTGDLLAANATAVCSGQSCCNYDQAYDNSQLINKCVKCADPTKPYFVKAKSQCGSCATGTFYSPSAVDCKPILPEHKVKLYQHCDYGGTEWTLDPGDYPSLGVVNIPNDAVSSVRVPVGLKVILYKHANFQGESVELQSDSRCLVDNQFNDETSSIKIIGV